MATVLWFVIQTLMGLVERKVNVEEGCDRDVTAPGDSSPARGGLEMLSKQKRNSRKLFKFRPSPQAWHGETAFSGLRAFPQEAKVVKQQVSLCLASLSAPHNLGSCQQLGEFFLLF